MTLKPDGAASAEGHAAPGGTPAARARLEPRRTRAGTRQSRAGIPPDEQLIPRLLAGEAGAFGLILDAWSSSMLRVARQYVRSEALGEEVVQESWQAVVTGLRRFEGRSSLKTWVFTIVANRARTRAVREARTVPLSALGDGDDGGPAVAPERFASGGGWLHGPQGWDVESPETLFLAHEGAAVIEREFALVPPMQASVVILRDIEGLSPVEVCNLLDITESNQRVLLHRGRGRLRRALERHLQGERG